MRGQAAFGWGHGTRIAEFRIQKPEFKMREAGPFWHKVNMSPAKTFRDLIAWQRSHELSVAIYQMTAGFPKHETFGLTSQLRRASVSVPANIAEGFKRMGKRDKLRFLNIAQASLEECRYYLILSSDLRYADVAGTEILLEEASKCLEGYVQRLLNSGF